MVFCSYLLWLVVMNECYSLSILPSRFISNLYSLYPITQNKCRQLRMFMCILLAHMWTGNGRPQFIPSHRLLRNWTKKYTVQAIKLEKSFSIHSIEYVTEAHHLWGKNILCEICENSLHVFGLPFSNYFLYILYKCRFGVKSCRCLKIEIKSKLCERQKKSLTKSKLIQIIWFFFAFSPQNEIILMPFHNGRKLPRNAFKFGLFRFFCIWLCVIRICYARKKSSTERKPTTTTTTKHINQIARAWEWENRK